MNSGSSTSPSIPGQGDISSAVPLESPIPKSALSQNLAIPILKFIESRSILLAIEAREVLQQLLTILIWLFMGAIAAFAGWLFLAMSAVGVLSDKSGWPWAGAAAAVGAAHLLIALALAFMMSKRLTSARWFTDSLNEFKKDHTWLKNQTPKK